MNTNQRVEYIKQNGYSLSFGETLNQAFDIFKGIFLFAGVGLLISGIIGQVTSTVLQGIMGFTIDPNEIVQRMQTNPESLNQFYLDTFATPMGIAYALAIILISGMLFPIELGIIYMCHKYKKTGSVDFSDLFYAYNGNIFGRALGLYYLFAILILVGFVFFILPGIYLVVALHLAGAFLVLNNDTPSNALKNSMTVVNKNWFTVFGLMIVGFLIYIWGFLALCIGLFFTKPLSHAIIYSIYKNSVGVDDETSEIEAIGKE